MIRTALQEQEVTHGPYSGIRSSDSKPEGGANAMTPPTKKHVYHTPKSRGAFTIALCQGIKMICVHERNIVSLEMEGGAFNLY